MKLSIILVEPQFDENLGYCARACLNFGADELILVNPTANKDSPIARARATHAKDLLQNTRITKTLDDALLTVDWSIASSSQKGSTKNLHRTHLRPRELGERLGTNSQRVGLVLGCEQSGLSNDDIGKCDALVTIPANPHYDSLNLSHALAILLYEINLARKKGIRDIADKNQKERLYKNFKQLLETNNAISNTRGALSTFKSLIAKAQPTRKEAEMLDVTLQKTIKRQNALAQNAAGENRAKKTTRRQHL